MWKLTKTKEIKYQAPEYKHFVVLRIINYFVITGLFIGTGFGSLFIYKNIFNTIEQINTIVFLNNVANIEIINFTQYDKVESAWLEKFDPTNIELKSDPFNPPRINTSTSPEKK